MKRLLLIVLPLFISFGYSQSINDAKLIKKGRLKYHPDTKELYSGKVFQNRMGGEKDFEGSYKDGKKDGLWTAWYENGQKKYERNYKDGESDGLYTFWYENGQKKSEGNYKTDALGNGNADGLATRWYENGQKQSEKNYKDGKRIGSATSWYENGKKMEEANFKDGKEISSKRWNEDGQVEDPTLSDEQRDALLQLAKEIMPESAYDDYLDSIESGKINKKNFKRVISKLMRAKKKQNNKK